MVGKLAFVGMECTKEKYPNLYAHRGNHDTYELFVATNAGINRRASPNFYFKTKTEAEQYALEQGRKIEWIEPTEVWNTATQKKEVV